jgi:predicted DCC family thiol-disulfide oxidoreductase YuxK
VFSIVYSTKQTLMNTRKYIIFYDGFCKLCSSSVQFIIKRDKRNSFSYLPLQSELAAGLISTLPQSKQHADSIVYAEGEKIYLRSTAVLKILRRLGRGWQLFYMFMLIPRPLRDFVYNIVSRYRIRWFGRHVSCYIPDQTDVPNADVFN